MKAEIQIPPLPPINEKVAILPSLSVMPSPNLMSDGYAHCFFEHSTPGH